MVTPNAWTIANDQYDAHTLGQFNSVCTVSNGYLGLKGSVAEDRDGYSPVCIVNGIYDELDMFSTLRASNEERRYLDPEYFDSAGKSPAVANLPSPLYVRLFVGDEEVTLTRGSVSGFTQGLDLRSGLYSYCFQYRDEQGRTTRVAMTRFASMKHVHRAYMRYAVTPLDHDAPITIRSGIDGRVHSNTTGERQFTVTAREHLSDEQCTLTARTPARGHEIEMAVASAASGLEPQAIRPVVEHDTVYTEYHFAPAANTTITLDRFVAVTTSEDARRGVAADVQAEMTAALAEGFDDALMAQQAAWEPLWARGDVQIEGDELGQRYLRFCLHHLMAAAPRHTDTLPVPVKLLTGEYYQGNTFYDTDLYILPMYLFTFPEWSRGGLNFRHLGLEPGRKIARELGYGGAKFAWQSGPNGEECLGHWYRFTKTNIHINADVAYALMQYYWATGDDAFMQVQGVDLLVETARFYASRATLRASDGTYDLVGVTGPDEGHVAVTNDFYTNFLAQRNLVWAADVLATLEQDAPQAYAAAVERLALQQDEAARWREVADKLTLHFDEATQVYEQCDGFYDLKQIPPELDPQRKAWFATVFPYQALNQPDVVMTLVMFRDDFAADVQRANWEFYKDKSMNFSSMSFVLNSIMAADMGEMQRAYDNFIISAGEDVDEELTGRKDTFAGLHGTAAGGAWMAAVMGFGGVNLSAQGLRIRPQLPEQWKSLRFNLMFGGELLHVTVDEKEVQVEADRLANVELSLTIGDTPVTLRSGQSTTQAYR